MWRPEVDAVEAAEPPAVRVGDGASARWDGFAGLRDNDRNGLAGSEGSVQPGGIIGLVGAMLLLVGGLLALAALLTAPPPAEPGAREARS